MKLLKDAFKVIGLSVLTAALVLVLWCYFLNCEI